MYSPVDRNKNFPQEQNEIGLIQLNSFCCDLQASSSLASTNGGRNFLPATNGCKP